MRGLFKVDALLVEFMKERFSEFWKYFGNELEGEDRPDARVFNKGEENERVRVENKEYRYFAGLLEEVQEDDLTILSIRKK